MIRTAFTDLVGAGAPVQQAPMSSISGPELAAAVADAGGVGTVTALDQDPDRLDALLADLTGRTSGVLCVNFLTGRVSHAAVRVAAARVRLVDFYWSDPDPELVALVHEGGALASWQVGSLEEARAAAECGVDVIAVQGVEAGGHVRGHGALLPLLSRVLDAVDRPVLAAGGIADARTLAAVLAAGAAGARIGTRFVASVESAAHPAYKEAIVVAEGRDTEITGAFADCYLCATSPRARVLDSAIEALSAFPGSVVAEIPTSDGVLEVPRGSGLPPGQGAFGEIGAMALYAGMGAGSVTEVLPAAEIVSRLTSGAERLLSR